MPGRMRGSARGQLALIDATVFFAAAMLISTALLSYAGRSSHFEDQSQDSNWKHVDEVLSVFLHCSIGVDLIVCSDPVLEVNRGSEVAECLAAETRAIMAGERTESFQALNDAYLRVLDACAGPAYDPCLIVAGLEVGETRIILAIPSLLGNVSEAHASCAQLPDVDEVKILVQLLLCPASSSELVQV